MLTFVEVDSKDHPLLETVRSMFEEYEQELNIDLCFQGFADELRDLPDKYAPPSGALLLLVEDGQPIVCGALRDLGDGVCELKRIYVRPSARRRGLGQAMSEKLMAIARDKGYNMVRLDTLERLKGAPEMYEKLGFRRIPAYNHNPEPDIVYFERALD